MTNQTGFEYALKCAREFGGEAAANGRPHTVTDDDTYDIAYYYGLAWDEMPSTIQTQLVQEFHAGHKSEMRLNLHLAHGGGMLDDIDLCEICRRN